MENIRIREAAASDVKETARVITMTWKETYKDIVPDDKLSGLSSDNFVNYLKDDVLSEDKVVFVAENEFQAIVGMVSGGPIKQDVEGYDAEMYALYVIPDMQGHGIGVALFRSLIVWLKNKGLKKVSAWVFAENNISITFFDAWHGEQIEEGSLEIAGKTLKTICYGWDLAAEESLTANSENKEADALGSGNKIAFPKEDDQINSNANQQVGSASHSEENDELV